MSLAETYAQIIRGIGDGTGAADSLLHVHGGMIALLVGRLLTRRSLATPMPFMFVVVAALLKEALDRWSYGSWRWEDTGADLVNTMFWPFVLMVGLRWRRATGADAVTAPPHDAASDQ